MKRELERLILSFTTITAIILLPFAIVKRSFKDWLIVYLVSCLGNTMADRYLVSKGYLKYKVRPYKSKFSIHIPFDYIHYPLLLLYYNQWTLNSKPLGLIVKLLVCTTPQVLFETILEKKTDLITWRKGWSWYHSFLSMALKLFFCRMIIGGIRVINKKQVSITST